MFLADEASEFAEAAVPDAVADADAGARMARTAAERTKAASF